MQFSYIFTTITVLFCQCVAQDEIEQIPDKGHKSALEDILKKINKISMLTFTNASYDNRLEMLRKVEEKLSKAAKSLGKKGERYVKLIMKGIKARTLEDINNNMSPDTQMEIPDNIQRSINISKNSTIHNDELVITIKSGNDTELKTVTQNDLSKEQERRQEILNHTEDIKNVSKNSKEDVNFVVTNQLRRMDVDVNERNIFHNHTNNIKLETSTGRILQSFTPHYECESILDHTCLNIKQMRQLKCHFDDTEVPIIKLCDGFVDCLDRTDEKFCTSQVTERVRNANQVISEAHKSFGLGCFPNNIKKSTMTTQIITLSSILQAQQEFVEKHKYLKRSQLHNKDPINEEGTVKKTVNEVSLVISALSLALDAAICSQRLKINDILNARKFSYLIHEDLDKAIKEVEWPPKSCGCRRGRCQNITCTDGCKRVCYQKYSLSRWGCESINKTENVPLRAICDGKFDCFDQSDERDCVVVTSFAKFEAHKLFKEMLNTLSVKITSNEYSSIRNTLMTLHHSIEDLQKSCMASEPDINIISMLRGKCFSILSSIYSESLAKSSFSYETEDIYSFLLTLNENIIYALKRSHTGNKRIIENDSCFCKNEKCSMPICSRRCIRACVAEPRITRYYCEKSPNISVSLEEICNSEPNCPMEEDESNCKKDICRRHHLSILRRSLQRIGKKQRGTSMGELLESWKIKVSSTLLIAENNDRPTLKNIRRIVRDILNDLVTTYGAVEDYRKNNEYALEEFTNIARHVMKTLRSCGY